MPPVTFAITFDYLCPFARNANEQVVAGLREGADWDVRFTPYSLSQGHLEEGEVDIWDRDEPAAESGILALMAGITVRDHFPERFLAVHEALFAARHDHGLDTKDETVIRDALTGAGADADEVFEHITSGEALETLRKEHHAGIDDHGVWGVPTFIAGERAVFARFLDRPEGNGAKARDQIARVVDMVANFPELHEFKQTELPF